MRNPFIEFQNKKILIIGDVMIDRYLYGNVNRISPEAPVPVLEKTTVEDRLGGAANVAFNIASMGAIPIVASVIGNDAESKILIKLFKKGIGSKKFTSDLLVGSNERMTTLKMRLLADSQQLIRVDQENTFDLTKNEEKNFISRLKEYIKKTKIDAIIFQDYNKGVLTKNVIEEITKLSTQKNIPITVDPKKKNFLQYQNCTLFKPNLKEIRESVPFAVYPEIESLRKASRFLKEKLQHSLTMITLSSKGLYLDDGIQDIILPTTPRNISDVSGAGDTVISLATLALSCNWDMKKIGILCNMGGGQVCEEIGVVPINLENLAKEWNDVLK
jgi:D-glycero-beta-D-manno-heptose-7-phosphate kinase